MLLYSQISLAWCYTRVLGPNSPSLRQHMAYCVDDPSVDSSEIWGTMCWNMERTKESKGMNIDCKAVEGQGDKACMWRWCQCVKVAEAVTWSKGSIPRPAWVLTLHHPYLLPSCCIVLLYHVVSCCVAFATIHIFMFYVFLSCDIALVLSCLRSLVTLHCIRHNTTIHIFSLLVVSCCHIVLYRVTLHLPPSISLCSMSSCPITLHRFCLVFMVLSCCV